MNSREKYRASHSRPTRADPKRPANENNGRKSSTITLSGGPRDPPYIEKVLGKDPLRQKGIVIKASTAWIDTYRTPGGVLSVPFIDFLGRFTGYRVYRWDCDPRALVTTTIATVTRRLLNYCRRHNSKRTVNRLSKQLVGAATYYVLSKNSYFWDRVLFFSRDLEKRGNLISKLRLFFSSKWDDDKRFVCSQALYQANWLLSRVYRPRDKSLFYSKRVKRTSWRKPSDSPSRLAITRCVCDIAYAISQI